MKTDDLYAWIAETAYQLKSKTMMDVSFHPTPVKRDATTRIEVVVDGKSMVFVISSHNPNNKAATPRDVYEHFNPRDEQGKRFYPETFVPGICERCHRHHSQHEVPGYRCEISCEQRGDWCTSHNRIWGKCVS